MRASGREIPSKRRRRWRRGRVVRPPAVCLALAAAALACASPPEPLNVVLITLDTFRADATGLHGNLGGHTPNIDALASEATVFANAVTPIGTTHPAHASLFTGLYPRQHGVRWNGDELDDRFATLAEILAASGYDTAAFVSKGGMLARGGLHQGFGGLSDGPEAPVSARRRDGDEVNEMGLSWLAARTGRPFFLWLHYFETHTPYRLSPHAEREHAAAGYDGALARGADLETVQALGREIPWTPAVRAALRALYDGEVREADRLVGEVVEALRAGGHLEDTVVIVTADHGEALGEHDEAGHGFLLSQPVLHVPLLVRVPGAEGPSRVETRVGLIDLAPTILDLVGVAVPPGLDGRSLAPALAGEAIAPRRYFAEVRAVGNHQFRTLADSDRYAVFDGPLKGVWEPESFRVFDLARDALELSPARPDEPRARELLRLVSSYRRGVREVPTPELDDDHLEELRALGYID